MLVKGIIRMPCTARDSRFPWLIDKRNISIRYSNMSIAKVKGAYMSMLSGEVETLLTLAD